jgi:YtxH-like protein
MNRERSNEREVSNFPTLPIVGFAVGALIGAGVALLLAPASGEKSRQRIGDTARRLRRDAVRTIDRGLDTADRLGADVQSAAQAGREAFHRDGVAHETHLGSRLSGGTHLAPEAQS